MKHPTPNGTSSRKGLYITFSLVILVLAGVFISALPSSSPVTRSGSVAGTREIVPTNQNTSPESESNQDKPNETESKPTNPNEDGKTLSADPNTTANSPSTTQQQSQSNSSSATLPSAVTTQTSANTNTQSKTTPSNPVDNTPTPQPSNPASSTPLSKYDHSKNNYNCDDFATWAEANEAFQESVRITGKDIHRLDGMTIAIEDGVPCESKPDAPKN